MNGAESGSGWTKIQETYENVLPNLVLVLLLLRTELEWRKDLLLHVDIKTPLRDPLRKICRVSCSYRMRSARVASNRNSWFATTLLAAMSVVNTKATFLLNLQQNRVHLPAKRNAFVLDPHHGSRDVTCKPAV